MNFQRILTHKVAPTRDPLTEHSSKAWFRRFIAAANNAAGLRISPCNEFQNASVLNWFRCYPWLLFLPRLHFLLFPDQHCVVMGVGTQVIIIMFDDNQITVAAQRVTGINNAPSAVAIIACPLLPAISIPLLPPQKRQRFRSLCLSRPAPGGDRRTG